MLGVIYGSAGVTHTLLANILLGGYAKTLHTLALVRAVAIVVRKVVIAAVIIQPYLPVINTALKVL